MDCRSACAQLGNLYREVSDEGARATVDASVDCRRAVLRHRPALRPRPLRATARALRSPSDHALSYVVSTKVGRALEPVNVVEGLDDDGFVVPATHRRRWDFSRDGIRRSLSESLERLGSRSRRHRLPPRSGRPLGRRAGDRLSGARRTARRRRRVGRRCRDEPVRDARRVRAAHGRRRPDARRPVHAARAEQPRRPSSSLPRHGAWQSSPPGSSTAACSPALARPTTVATTTVRRRLRSSNGHARSPRSARRHGTTLPAAAIAFPLAHPAVVSVCVGARSAEQIHRNASLRRESIAPDLWLELKAERLLREDAPVPA